MLKYLSLDFNSLESLEDFSGALDDLRGLKVLSLNGNGVSCEEVQTGKEAWGSWECRE
jgi:hypothetical protein